METQTEDWPFRALRTGRPTWRAEWRSEETGYQQENHG